MLQAAGKADALSDPDGALTILAPNNDAFAKIPEEDLQGLLANPMALMAVHPPPLDLCTPGPSHACLCLQLR